MIKPSAFIAAAALGLFAATALAEGGETVQTRQAMVDGVNPAALAIWEVTNAAMNDEGGLDPALIDAEEWAKIAEAAQMLEVYGKRMAEAKTIVAGGPDLVSGDMPPGVASREEIQALIAADPHGFRAGSADMPEQAAALAAAAKARDAAAAGNLASGIDGACQACHTRYWYLQEPAAG
jgi:cytochrome c556